MLSDESLREQVFDPTVLNSHSEVMRCLDAMSTESFGLCAPESFAAIDEEGKLLFEFWNKEYINAFGNYLAGRVKYLGGTEECPVRILEVGAGNGALTHFLREKLATVVPGRVTMVACDLGASAGWAIDSVFSVQELDHQEAIAKYEPHIIIFSWMPYKYDCTADFRAAESVQEYILIGERGGGCCGDEWKTWGLEPFGKDREKGVDYRFAPYERDGFERVYAVEESVSEFQISRTRFINAFGNETSITASFRRKR